MNEITVFTIAAILLTGAVLAMMIFIKRSFQRISEQLDQKIHQNLPQLLQKPFIDLTERVTQQGGETRLALSNQINQQMLASQERLDRTLGSNRQELQSGLGKTTLALEEKFQSLEQKVNHRLEKIGENVESKLNENLKEGFKHFEKVQEHLHQAEKKLESLNTVGESISSLNSLLKLPHLRGGFGEATLERLLADFLPKEAYELQYQISGSTERVDAVVKMANQVLPIDSKFPREQVLPLFESDDPTELEKARKNLSSFIREQAKSIATKYIKPEQGTSEMALLFLPSETLYFEVTRDSKLFEALTKLRVFPVSPNTLAISLHSVFMAREYYEMARGVEKTIKDIQTARKHFENFEKRFFEVGKGLQKAQTAYETASTHLGRYESSVVRLTGDSEAQDKEPATLPGLDH